MPVRREQIALAREIADVKLRMPAKLVDVDLAAEPIVEPVSLRYGTAHVLVRLHGRPLGYLDVLNSPEWLSAAALRQGAAERLGSTLWADWLQRRWSSAATASMPTADLLPISVIVCTRDRPHELEGCLAALVRQTYPSFEILVVDNAPSDESTRLVAERYAVHYVTEPRPGLDWARNTGWRAARAPIVAYIDDDARAEPGWLRGLAAGFCAPEVQAVTGLVLPAELETAAQRLFEHVYGGMSKGFRSVVHSARGRSMTHRPQRYGVGCNMAFRRSVIRAVGGFDPALDVGTLSGGGGDLDLFQRLVETDGAIAYRPDAIVRHIHRRTMRQLRRQLFDNGRGYAAVFTTMLLRNRGHARLEVLYWWLAWWGYWFAFRSIRRLLGRERLPLRLILVELAGFALGPFLYLAARRRAAKVRLHEEP